MAHDKHFIHVGYNGGSGGDVHDDEDDVDGGLSWPFTSLLSTQHLFTKLLIL